MADVDEPFSREQAVLETYFQVFYILFQCIKAFSKVYRTNFTDTWDISCYYSEISAVGSHVFHTNYVPPPQGG